MTICIAAMCIIDKDRNGIVFCADRLRSSYMHRFEGNAKYKEIKDRAILMGSGEVELIDEVLEDDFLQILGSKSIEEMARLIVEKIKKLIQRRIEDKVLSKHNLNAETYLKISKEISEILIEKIEEEKEQLLDSLELEFILAGCDPDGKTKLYTITKNQFYPHVTQNIALIGSGTTISNLELSKEYQNAQIGLSEAMLHVYKAKRSAESDFYVGAKTDIGVLYPIQDSGRYTIKIDTFGDELKEILDKELYKIKDQENEGMEEIKVRLNNLFYGPAKIEPEELSETKNLQLEFWEKFTKYLEENGSSIRTRTPRPQHWYDTSIGSSQAHLSFTVNTQEGLISCEIYIDKKKELFNYLKSKKEIIERKLEKTLDWMELPNKKASRIKLSVLMDITQKEIWESAFKWLQEWGEKLKDVFVEEIKKINISDLEEHFDLNKELQNLKKLMEDGRIKLFEDMADELRKVKMNPDGSAVEETVSDKLKKLLLDIKADEFLKD